MEVEFSSNRLRRCYEAQSEGSQTWGPAVARKFIERINLLYAVDTFQELYTVKSLRLHELTGPRKGQYAITLHGRWRIILAMGDTESEIRVEEVTNHYGD